MPVAIRIQDARCLKVKPRERAFKQFKSPVLNVLSEGLMSTVQVKLPTVVSRLFFCNELL